MKKAMLIFLSVIASVSVAACSLPGKNSDSTDSVGEEFFDTYDIPKDTEREYDIALITDSTGIESEQNLNLWKSIIAYGDTNCKTYKYYPQTADSSVETLIDEAVENNAKIIILPDSSYKNILFDMQNFYPEISFIIVNTQPDELFSENVHSVKFREEQAGYLAGYLAVLDGNSTLGFIGDGSSDKNMRYLYGMVQGADDATQKLRLHDITITYKFIENQPDKAKSMAEKFYKNGADVIFTCTENIAKGASQAAESAKKKIICGERVFEGTDKVSLAYIEYDTVKAVDYTIKSAFDSDLDWIDENSSKDMNLGIDSECVKVSTDESLWNFKNITSADYDDIVNRIIGGEVEISDITESRPPIAAVVYSEFEE